MMNLSAPVPLDAPIGEEGATRVESLQDDATESADDTLEIVERDAVLRGLVDCLDPLARTVVIGRYFEGVELAELAERLKKPGPAREEPEPAGKKKRA